MAIEQTQMLREISHDVKTPKKRDTVESSNDFFLGDLMGSDTTSFKGKTRL